MIDRWFMSRGMSEHAISLLTDLSCILDCCWLSQSIAIVYEVRFWDTSHSTGKSQVLHIYSSNQLFESSQTNPFMRKKEYIKEIRKKSTSLLSDIGGKERKWQHHIVTQRSGNPKILTTRQDT
jgi:hypothetical protein